MRLDQLLASAGIAGAEVIAGKQSSPDVEITHIAENSRIAQAGTLFVAVVGSVHDGHKFVPDALERGAVAVAGTRTERPEDLADNIPYVHVPDDRAAVAQLSAAFFDHPSRKLAVVGVTGTDGKTSTSTLIHSILISAGKNAGLISTIRAEIAGRSYDTGFHVTTPEAFDVQRYLSDMVEAGTDVAVLETTSHALDQGRVLCVDYDVAVVTNVTHEHMAEGRVEGRDFWQVHDRAEAIAFAIGLAQPGDMVITCGKSHESSMAYGTDETPWDEFAAARAGLARRKAG